MTETQQCYYKTTAGFVGATFCPYCNAKVHQEGFWLKWYRLARALFKRNRNMQIMYCSTCDSMFELRVTEVYQGDKLWADRREAV